jgi:hypothetical protein
MFQAIWEAGFLFILVLLASCTTAAPTLLTNSSPSASIPTTDEPTGMLLVSKNKIATIEEFELSAMQEPDTATTGEFIPLSESQRQELQGTFPSQLIKSCLSGPFRFLS